LPFFSIKKSLSKSSSINFSLIQLSLGFYEILPTIFGIYTKEEIDDDSRPRTIADHGFSLLSGEIEQSQLEKGKIIADHLG
jgi:hypothetical protein